MKSNEEKIKALEKKIRALERILNKQDLLLAYYEKLMELAREEYGIEFKKTPPPASPDTPPRKSDDQ